MRQLKIRMSIGALGALALALTATAASAASIDDLKLERVFLLMRHGVRAPDRDPPTSPGVTADAWPAWPVKPGWLTDHGRAAVALIASYDRARLVGAGLLPAQGCPPPGALAIRTNSLERTIETGVAYVATLAPGCAMKVEHQPQDQPDPMFPWGFEKAAAYDPEKANAGALAALAPDSAATAVAKLEPLLLRLDHILCGPKSSGCGVAARPTAFHPATPGRQPALSGGLEDAEDAAQDLVLEYAEGWALSQVGWGRATVADLTAISALTSFQFRFGSRPAYTARLNDGPLFAHMLQALDDPGGARLTVVVAHDGNIASLAGLLDLHWQVPGFAADYPPPGGAIGFERLSDRQGRLYVRAFFRSQSLDQIRALTRFGPEAAPYRAVLPIPGCKARGTVGLCTLAQFEQLAEPAS